MEFEDELSLEKYLAESVRTMGQNSNSSDDEGAEKEGRMRLFLLISLNSCEFNHGSSLNKDVLRRNYFTGFGLPKMVDDVKELYAPLH